MYITPYLDEVERVCNTCDFDQPDDDGSTKLKRLKKIMSDGENVAATHALFLKMDEELLQLADDKNYSLICDEELDVASQIMISEKDMKQLQIELVTIDEDGRITWNDAEYRGRYEVFKDIITNHLVYAMDSAWVRIMNPEIFRAFDEVTILTYMFKGQYQRAYFDSFGMGYDIVGVGHKFDTFYFTDMPDIPEKHNYRDLIRIVDSNKMNAIGDKRTALSKSWYMRHGRGSQEIQVLRNNMNNFFRNMTESERDTRLWTCYKSEYEKLLGNSGRFRNNYLFLNAKATNEFRKCDSIAYMVNLFPNPNLEKVFSDHNVYLEPDDYALSSMLQFVWRGAIRDGKPIDLYVPSSRMRGLLNGWIDNNS